MSEIRLNLVDSQTILTGTIHGSIGDSCVAALSAEPETISELVAALERFEKDPPSLQSFFSEFAEIDDRPYDAGILVIDLAARIVACESTYSLPGPQGHVNYHNGQCGTDIPIFYRVPEDWIFVTEVEEYKFLRTDRREQRANRPPFDAREILYGLPLLKFLATNVRYASACPQPANAPTNADDDVVAISPIGQIHAQWLLTPRYDLQGQSPRDVLLAKRNFISSDLESRALQWSMLLEGPPCLSRDSFAYRFAGFGPHEWVLYYDMIRYLLRSTIPPHPDLDLDVGPLVKHLESLKGAWLNEPNTELEGRIPAIIIDNERRRLPEAMGGRSMVVDEDCPLCKMMGDECEAGTEVCFWHLDGCNMEDHFAFSSFLTEEEYLEDKIKLELWHREFDRKWKEREERIARGEPVEPDPFFDPPTLGEFVPFALAEPEPPEA